jgi:heterodisulfide reductase subunit C
MERNLALEIERLSGQKIGLCYHCHKCTAGCPVASAMSIGPERVLRLAILDEWETVLHSPDIWLCTGCFTCSTRCPNEIDIARVMDALRQLAVWGEYPPGEPDAYLFHKLFLGVVRRLGRSHEATMLGLFKVLSRVPLIDDMGAGIGLFERGKVPLLPTRSGAGKAMREIFERAGQLLRPIGNDT